MTRFFPGIMEPVISWSKSDGDRLEVRLVTVRQYGPLADPEDMSV